MQRCPAATADGDGGGSGSGGDGGRRRVSDRKRGEHFGGGRRRSFGEREARNETEKCGSAERRASEWLAERAKNGGSGGGGCRRIVAMTAVRLLTRFVASSPSLFARRLFLAVRAPFKICSFPHCLKSFFLFNFVQFASLLTRLTAFERASVFSRLFFSAIGTR